MPITYEINKSKKRIESKVSGKFTLDDITNTIKNSINDPDFENGYNILSDHTEIEEFITTPQVHYTIEILENFSKHLENSKWAIVTKKPASYGMMRMLSAFADDLPLKIQIFENYEDAEKWLS